MLINLLKAVVALLATTTLLSYLSGTSIPSMFLAVLCGLIIPFIPMYNAGGDDDDERDD